MKSIASAPGKVILFGEHFVVYGVKAILCSIDKRVTVTSSTSPEESITIKSTLGNLTIPISEPYEDNSPLKPFAFIAKKMIREFDKKSGLEITIKSDLLPGIGLGSSSACCVAAAASISNLFTKLSKEEVRKLAIDAEKTIFKNTSGADCTVCTYGGIIEYDKKSGFKQLTTNSDFSLVIANSMTTHSTDVVANKVKEFREENPQVFSSLCNDESKLIEKVNSSLSKNNLNELGQIMSENQNYLEKIGVANDKLRSMIQIAKETSFGAKITGAGGGGCIIALVDKSNYEQTISNLKSNNLECFSVKIDSKGLIQEPIEE